MIMAPRPLMCNTKAKVIRAKENPRTRLEVPAWLLVAWWVVLAEMQRVATSVSISICTIAKQRRLVDPARKVVMCASRQTASRHTRSKMPIRRRCHRRTDIRAEKFHPQFLHRLVLELCCGTAGLTASFKRCGLANCIAVDKLKCRGAKASVTQLDLTKVSVQKMIIQWLHHPFVVGLFWAPPCGMASAARQIELPDEPGPKPLRSVLEPDGFEGLSDLDLLRVSQANILYTFCAETMSLCVSLGKPTMCENPRSSLFWLVTPWVESLIAEVGYISDHQACAYGSDRPKWTRLVASFPEVKSISAVCPGNHKHAAWGRVAIGNKRVFATSLEVHYPTQLCDAIAHAFLMAFYRLGCKRETNIPLNPAAQVVSGKQSATNKLPPAVPEYKSRICTLWNKDNCVWPHNWANMKNFKLLHKISVGSEVVEQLHSQILSVFDAMNCSVVPSLEQIELGVDGVRVFGVQWEPEEFCKAAIKSEHPMSVQSVLPPELRDLIDMTVSTNPLELAKERLRYLLKWNRRASELQADERNGSGGQAGGCKQTHFGVRGNVGRLQLSRLGCGVGAQERGQPHWGSSYDWHAPKVLQTRAVVQRRFGDACNVGQASRGRSSFFVR